MVLIKCFSNFIYFLSLTICNKKYTWIKHIYWDYIFQGIIMFTEFKNIMLIGIKCVLCVFTGIKYIFYWKTKPQMT